MSNPLQSVLESHGFRTATSRQRRVAEAAKVFAEGVAGRSHTARAVLTEAFTTSDFPVLLGQAFEIEARASFRQVTDETTSIATVETVQDFRPKKIRDLFSDTYFEKVAEGEEYKGDNPFAETEVQIQGEKYGRNYGLTWELMLNQDFAGVADFPGLLGRGAANTRNKVIYQQLVADGGLRSSFFSKTGTDALGYQSLKNAKEYLGTVENQHGDPLDVSQLVLIVPPALEDTAVGLTTARSVNRTFDDGSGNLTEIEQNNPLAGLQVQVSREFAKQLGSSVRSSAWALVPGASTDNPVLARAQLAGHPDVDIRVKRDAGDRVGGGQVPFEDGSFDDDTIWYRGRSITGATPAFNQGAYGSTGSA